MKIKICGITNLRDAQEAVDAGANALGFNFYERSPRYLSPAAARSITRHLPNGVMKVGVFVNERVDGIVETMATVRLDAIQLHGDETSGFVADLRRQVDCELIKAFRVGETFDPEAVHVYDVDGVLLDGFSPRGRGGTGEIFDWDVAKSLSQKMERLWLAGGLSPENVAVAVSHVRPYGVDACSSLESSAGIKDIAKVRSFIAEAKSA